MKQLNRAAAAALLVCACAQAERKPEPLRQDDRIKTVSYHADDVIHVHTALDRATVLEFPGNEPVLDMLIGDSSGWRAQVAQDGLGSRIILKPTTPDAGTNLTVVTAARVYLFDLEVGRKADYLIRFHYPEDEFEAARRALQTAPGRLELLAREGQDGLTVNIGNLRHDYSYDESGSAMLRPTVVYDDGEFTFFEFRPGQDIPAIYAVAADGRENLVNYSVGDGPDGCAGCVVAVHGVAAQYMLRYGSEALCIFNERYAVNPMPSSVFAGTSR